jgi:RHS repeat-associated protein
MPPQDTPCGLQNLHYTYDPAGNITTIRDDAQQTIYFDGEVVRPDAEYKYDAIYRLIESHGREHIGQASIPHSSWNDRGRVNLAHPNDGSKMRNYFEFYQYDEVGNILKFDHKDRDINWIRTYDYSEPSLIEPGKTSNRLSSTTVGGAIERYKHDPHGNIEWMPHLVEVHQDPNDPNMHWDFKDQLQMVDLKGGGTAYYVYDAAGQRMRKVVEKNNNGALIEERIYLGRFEVFRRSNGSGIKLERETLHIMDDQQRIALVETRIQGDDPSPEQLIRYQLGNYLGSASLELDVAAQVVSYEEHYPFGSTSYQAVSSQTKTPKRYRYTGMERDEEIGLNYHGARYYALWLGRWTSSDPAGLVDGLNLFRYARNSPLANRDLNGKESINFEEVRSYQERSVQLNMNYEPSRSEVSHRLTIRLQDPNTGDRYSYSSSGDIGGLRTIHQQLLEYSGFTRALTPQEREALFSSLEGFAQMVGSISPSEEAPSRLSQPSETTLRVAGDVARGIEANRVIPQRYRLEPPRGATVTGIRDTQAGRIRGNPPRPVGAPVIRVDRPHGRTNYPHVNIETLAPDPHYRISSRVLRAAGRLARGLNAAGRVARPLAIVTDAVRLGSAIHEDQGVGRNTARTAASVAGGWAGAFAGAWLGAKAGAALGGLLGSVVPGLGNAAGAAIGGLLGGLFGAIAGGFFGSRAGEVAADAGWSEQNAYP